MSDWDLLLDETCACGSDNLVMPCGVRNSEYLIIGEYPGREEMKCGKPFSGPTGGILREELRRVGLSLSNFRICNLWLHEPNKNKDCLDFGTRKAVKEAQGKKVIILIGSDVVKQFCGLSVSDVTGLRVQSSYLSAPHIFACIQPATVFRGTIGEFRLSLQKIATAINEMV